MKELDPNIKKIRLSVRNAETVVYDNFCKGVSSVNDKADFDVLPMHSNFISIVKDYVRIHELSGKIRNITISSGVLRVKKDIAEIFLGI